MGTRWLHRQLRLTLPITDINSFLASLDINILWIWICHPMVRTKTEWRNWKKSYDPTNTMLPSSFFPLQTRRASVQVMQSSGQRSGFKGRRPAPCSLFCHWTLSKNKIGIQIFPAGRGFYRKSRAIKAEELFVILLLVNCSSSPGAHHY